MSIIYSKYYFDESTVAKSNNDYVKEITKSLIKNHNYNSSTGTAFIKP